MPSRVPPSTDPVRSEESFLRSAGWGRVALYSRSDCSLLPPSFTSQASRWPATATSVTPEPVLVGPSPQVAAPLTWVRTPLSTFQAKTLSHGLRREVAGADERAVHPERADGPRKREAAGDGSGGGGRGQGQEGAGERGGEASGHTAHDRPGTGGTAGGADTAYSFRAAPSQAAVVSGSAA